MQIRRAIAVLSFPLLAFCLIAFAAVRSAEAMSFRLVEVAGAGSVIAASGQITESTPGEFLAFVRENAGTNGLHAVVFLDSPGGKVLASMQFGTLLRRIGAAAVVADVADRGDGTAVITSGQCYSACVYALMGGRKRVVPPSSTVGIHRMFAYQAEVDNQGDTYLRRRYDNGAMGSILKRYTSSMGVSPALISAAEHIPSSGLRILSRGEIQRYHLGVPHL